MYRGYNGKCRAADERWRKVRVAPSKHALNLVRLRSKIVDQRGDWVELFDRGTGTYWYLNKRTAHSSWKPPEEFEENLFCHWEPVRESTPD